LDLLLTFTSPLHRKLSALSTGQPAHGEKVPC
jgi:hypothetical protein